MSPQALINFVAGDVVPKYVIDRIKFRPGFRVHSSEFGLVRGLANLSFSPSLSHSHTHTQTTPICHSHQPFDEYCITRKELHELLVKHQNTAFELEKAREDTRRLERELESRRTFFEK